MTTPAEILAQLRADMQGAKERGMRFVRSCVGNRRFNYWKHLPVATARFDITVREWRAIVRGYDNLPDPNYPAYHAIGATLRAEFPPEG